MNFSPCPVTFPPFPAATEMAELARLIHWLKNIGEPYIGIIRSRPDLLCKQIEVSTCSLPTKVSPDRRALRCCSMSPWYQYLSDELENLRSKYGYPVTPLATVEASLLQAQSCHNTLNSGQISAAIALLASDFRCVCVFVAAAQKKISNHKWRHAEKALEFAQKWHDRTMGHFKHLRAVLPKDIDSLLYWRGTP